VLEFELPIEWNGFRRARGDPLPQPVADLPRQEGEWAHIRDALDEKWGVAVAADGDVSLGIDQRKAEGLTSTRASSANIGRRPRPIGSLPLSSAISLTTGQIRHRVTRYSGAQCTASPIVLMGRGAVIPPVGSTEVPRHCRKRSVRCKIFPWIFTRHSQKLGHAYRRRESAIEAGGMTVTELLRTAGIITAPRDQAPDCAAVGRHRKTLASRVLRRALSRECARSPVEKLHLIAANCS